MKAPLLFLPGMMCDARLFSPQINQFSASRPVMVAPLAGSASFTGMAEAILSQAPAKFALAGLSMGGIAAMEIIRQAPERVTGLALMDTNPLAEPLDRRENRNRQIETVRAGGLRSVMCDEMKPNYLTDSQNRQDILDLCMLMADSLGDEVFIEQSLALQSRQDYCGVLRDIKIPTLVLCGKDDRLCPPERHQLMHDLISDSQLAVIAGAGHLPTLEQPEKTNEQLKKWLNLVEPISLLSR